MADLIRVILVDDHAVVRAGLRAVLSTASDIDVVAGASNGRDAVVVAARCPADVIVMDLRVDQLDGIMALRGVLAGRVQRSMPDTADQLLLASLCERELNVLRLIAEGFAGPLIGEKMAISAKAVDSYKQRIGEKLGASGRPSFVRFALRVGLLNTRGTPESPLYFTG